MINISHNCLGNDAMSQDITWSVSIEEQFYLFFPLIFVFLARKIWAYAISCGILIGIVFRIMYIDDGATLYFHSLSGLLDLCIGAITACLILRFSNVRSFFETRSTGSRAILIVIALATIYWQEETCALPCGPVWTRVLMSTVFALVIASQAMTTQQSKLNLGNWKYAHGLGKYTYAIYLLHPIVILFLEIVMRVTPLQRGPISLTIIGVCAYPLTIIISKLSYRYYESRFLKLKDRFSTITQ